MTPDAFRALALEFAGTVEGTHMAHADFRVQGRIFATLGYPSDEFAAIMLTPEEQSAFVRKEPHAFMPVKGAWGLKGSTNVRLPFATPKLAKEALFAAWSRKAAKPARRRRTKGQ